MPAQPVPPSSLPSPRLPGPRLRLADPALPAPEISSASVAALVLIGVFSAAVVVLFCNSLGPVRLLARSPSLFGPLLAAAFCVVPAALAAAACAWLFSPLAGRQAHPQPALLVYAAIAWLLAVPVTLFLLHDSPVAVLLAVAAAAAVAVFLRRSLPIPAPAPDFAPPPELFSGILRTRPRSFRSLALALCLYAAVLAFDARLLPVAAALLAVSAFSLAWQATAAPVIAPEIGPEIGPRTSQATSPATDQETSPAASPEMSPATGRLRTRLSAAFLLSLFLTAVALTPGIAHSPWAGLAPAASRASAAARSAHRAAVSPGDAWAGIILWPVRKKQIPLPQLTRTPVVGNRLVRPLVIPFSGPYWYYEQVGHWPGLHAHIARGDPSALDIHTNDRFPLLMEAHQTLADSIDLAACGQIQVTVADADRRPGAIALGVVLTDEDTPGKPSLYLGAQGLPMLPPAPGAASPPQDETLTFSIPRIAKIRRFSHIAVLFYPDAQRASLGSRIAIRQFELFPR